MTLATEARNPRTTGIDEVDTLAALRMVHAEDATVAAAVEQALPALAEAVDVAAARLAKGGTLHYFGAGSSGLLGLLDASELPGTFGWTRARAHVAGGLERIGDSDQGVEDDVALGARDAEVVTAADVAVGITASGTTPYISGVLDVATSRGALRLLVTCNAESPLAKRADVSMVAETGPEAIAGSTRMKAGTAQKLILNSFSTMVMVRLGRTYSNLMVDVIASNAKLRERALNILGEATGQPRATCEAALARCDGHTKTALVSLVAGATALVAEEVLKMHGGRAHDAIAALHGTFRPGSG